MVLKRYAALALTLMLLLTCIGPASAATPPYNYVALGDSIAAGYGLANPMHSYPVRLTGAIGASGVTNLSRSGMTSREVLEQLSNLGVQDRIQDADLITVSAGCADVLGVLLETVKQVAGTDDVNAIVADPEKLAAVAAALQSAPVQATFSEAIAQAASTLAQIDATLKQLNPSAKRVYTSGYNPYTGFNLFDFQFGVLSDSIITSLNAAIASALPGAAIVDVKALFSAPGAPHCVNATLASPVNLDPHPNAAGHALIASAIQKLVAADFPSVRYPAYVAVSTAKLTLYKSAGSGKLGTLAKGSSVLVYKWNDTWARIGNARGYAYVKLAGLKLNTLMATPIRRVQVKSTRAVARTSASATATALATLLKGNQVVVYEITGKWARVQVGDAIGYIETKNLTKV